MLTAAILLLALAYVAKAACDNLTHQAGNSIFERWGPWFDARTSWKNKYAAGSWEAGAPLAPLLAQRRDFTSVLSYQVLGNTITTTP